MLSLLLHLSQVIKDVNDLKGLVAWAVANKKIPPPQSWEVVVQDIMDLVKEGAIQIPGVPPETLTAIVQGLEDGLKAIESK